MIARGDNTLILAPTGSGKTLAAFLVCLDALWRQSSNDRPKGVQVLYISPLKALNNDVHRNLQRPLEGIQKLAMEMGFPLPSITAGLRTGDTPTSDRQKQLRNPPQVLITTPESLNLLLTSQGRAILHTVRYCIVDEIHVLSPNKRGVFLSILLERLQQNMAPATFQRIGLSATQRPLEEVAKYLGGLERQVDGSYTHRPVSIADAGRRKELDLEVVCPMGRFGPMEEKTVWPSIYRYLVDQVRANRSTIIFANNRRSVERITSNLNLMAIETEQAVEELPTFDDQENAELPPQDSEPTDEAVPTSAGLFAKSHHGSISLEARKQTEEDLKSGQLPVVVATASLELGIDMGAVDLVCQVESPGNIARGMQRVGRAGHLVGGQSIGKLIAKTLPDLVEQSALCHEMLHGQVEALHIPSGCLDILAQQIVAMVAIQTWPVTDLYKLIRQAYPFRNLSPELFDSVLSMLSGRFSVELQREIRPRISWDRVQELLHPLPGSKQIALVNGGTIPDTGMYPTYIDGTDVRIGELDEEFIYERRIGDVFLLGTQAWRIQAIESDRVLVSRASGPAIMPFWRGERNARSAELGQAVGEFLRTATAKLQCGEEDLQQWLEERCKLDGSSRENIRHYIKDQIERSGHVPTDTTIIIEAFRDQIGDWYLAVLSTRGSRFHLSLRFVIESWWREAYGYQPYCLHHDDGILIRLVDNGEDPPLDLLNRLNAENVESQIVAELGDSALFAIRFRQNAARSLMLPVSSPQKRAPLWLQRLKAKNLLQMARKHTNFPIIVETYRECVQEHLDIEGVKSFLQQVQAGTLEVVAYRAETPSPFASQLLFSFTAAFMYDYDSVEQREQGRSETNISEAVLGQFTRPEEYQHLLDPRSVEKVENRLRGLGKLPRTETELAEWVRWVGDVKDSEVVEAIRPMMQGLASQRRMTLLSFSPGDERWVLTEERPIYETMLGRVETHDLAPEAARQQILFRFLQSHALVTVTDIVERYPLDADWVRTQLQEWSKAGQAVSVLDTAANLQWSAPSNLEAIQKGSLSVRRTEVVTVSRETFAHFLLRWQYRHPSTMKEGPAGLRAVLDRLTGFPLPYDLWEKTILPGRLKDYQSRWLDELGQEGEWLWAALPLGSDPSIAFFRREEVGLVRPLDNSILEGEVGAVFEGLTLSGANFTSDLSMKLRLQPSKISAALHKLAKQGRVTNDRFDVVRKDFVAEEIPGAGSEGRVVLQANRARRLARPQGRWSRIPWGQPDTESLAVLQVQWLLERYGIVSREMALLDETMLPWRVLYETLSRLELTGEVRRGYFVEGLSGAQFAWPDAMKQLQQLHGKKFDDEPMLLLSMFDPANLWGVSLPLGWPGQVKNLEEEVQPSKSPHRRSGTWLVCKGAVPILIIEAHGKKLTPIPGSSETEQLAALMQLPELFKTGLGIDLRGKISVETWGGEPVLNSAGQALLLQAGFVRDYPVMTMYAVWR